MAIIVKPKYKNQKDHLPSVMKAVINYCLQEHKTNSKENPHTISGQNCTPELAFHQFIANKAAWKKNKGLCFRHYIQSFSPDEKLTPKEANRIGLEFAARAWQGYGVLVSTHSDKGHIHNHFIIDTVNVETGHKLHEDIRNFERLRAISDEICIAHGLSTLSPYQNDKVHSISGREYCAGSKGDSWKFRLRGAIKYAMEHSGNREEFIANMKKLGYGVRWEDGRKNITYTCCCEPKYKNGAYRKCCDDKLSDEKYLKEVMEYEFRIRQEILTGRDDRNEHAEDNTRRRNTYGTDHRGGLGGDGTNNRRNQNGNYGTDKRNEGADNGDQGAKKNDARAGGSNEEKREQNREHSYEHAWEAERKRYFESQAARRARRQPMVDKTTVNRASNHAGIALGGLLGLASAINTDDSNKTAEEIEAEERARLAGDNVVATLKLMEMGVKAFLDDSEEDELYEDPTMKL